jgi:hypothetical protein
MAHDTAPRAASNPRPISSAREWWLIGPPALLLFAKTGATLGQYVNPIESLSRGEAVVDLTFAALALAAGLALVARRYVGWLLAMTIVGWSLAVAIVSWWQGAPNYLTMALLAVAAVLITSGDMRRLFAARKELG